MPRAAFHTIGCKLNTYETEMLRHQFAHSGYDVVDEHTASDITVINTCTVTARADADCRKIIRRARRRNSDAMIVVTGCFAERVAEQLDGMDEVDLVVGNTEKTGLLARVETALGHTTTSSCHNQSDDAAFLTIQPAEAARAHSLTRATLQIQDGCDEHCTYCIIPSVRGDSRSRPLGEIVRHAGMLADAGYLEIALTGVNTGSYGLDDTSDNRLIDVLRAVVSIDGIQRVRINSIEPNTIDEELIDYITSEPKICRHYHIPLQNGCDDVLHRMNRRYLTADYERVVRELHSRQPGAAIGADVMVGFPGETDEQFEETRSFLESLPLTYLHVFSYSQREGTPATRLGGQHSHQTKDQRNRELRKISLARRESFHARHVGEIVPVLIEDSHDAVTGSLRGLTDNYVRVTLLGDHGDELVNQIVPVRILSSDAEGATGELCDASASDTLIEEVNKSNTKPLPILVS
jgi:threonylcarbamoyladenosine tRNA methylthiotransferase MtaB